MTTGQKRIKIIFDASPMLATKTGIAYYTERLAVNVAKKYPDEVELVGFYYNFLGRKDTSVLPRLPNLRYTGNAVLPSKIIYQLRRWGIEFPIELLALERADFLLFPNFISYPSLFHTPQAPVIHDLTFIDLPEYVSPKLQRDLERFVPRDIKRSSFVVTVSEFTKKRITEAYGTSPNNILVTPIPPTPHTLIDEPKRQTLLKNAGITRPFILFVGTIEPRKNIVNLIEAYKQLPESLRNQYSLVLVGRLDQFAAAEDRAIAEAKQQGFDVIHPGYISDETKGALYQSAALFAHASQYEGFGMPVLEAMSYATPCVLSDIPIFREVAGDAAQYFDEHNPAAIARTTSSVLSDKNQLAVLSKRAEQRAAIYSWDAVARALYERIEQAVRTR